MEDGLRTRSQAQNAVFRVALPLAIVDDAGWRGLLQNSSRRPPRLALVVVVASTGQ